jgi:uncharacterized protein
VSLTQLAWIVPAGFAAGAVNALAGGGTLISFPVLVAAGLPAVAANLTSTIALCPGYLGATYAQRLELRDQRGRLYALLPVSLLGGLLGAALLLHTGERRFAQAVPWLLLAACLLLALQDRLRSALRGRQGTGAYPSSSVNGLPLWLLPLVLAGATYGGFFGAGMSVIILALLAMALSDPLPRLNALKQALALGANLAAALWLAASAAVDWRVVTILALSALLGGLCGGRLAGRLSEVWLRRSVVALGISVAALYLWRAR